MIQNALSTYHLYLNLSGWKYSAWPKSKRQQYVIKKPRVATNVAGNMYLQIQVRTEQGDVYTNLLLSKAMFLHICCFPLQPAEPLVEVLQLPVDGREVACKDLLHLLVDLDLSSLISIFLLSSHNVRSPVFLSTWLQIYCTPWVGPSAQEHFLV